MAKSKAATKGFRFAAPDIDTATIRFEEGHRLHGLEIAFRREMPVGILVAAENQHTGQLLELFAGSVVSWNVVDDNDEPVPFSVQEFGKRVYSSDLDSIIGAWKAVMTEPGTPLSQPSNGSAPSAAR